MTFTAPQRRPALGWPVALTVLSVAAALWLRLLPITNSDVALDFVPWFNHAVVRGPVAVFQQPWGAYTPPYLYCLAALTPLKGALTDAHVIKLLAFLAALTLVAATWRVLRALDVRDAAPLALCLLAVPTVMLNAAALGQCDSLYAAPVMMALAAVLGERPRTALAWYGLALSIKLQAILIGPFFLGWMIARRVPVRYWPIAPLAFAAAFLPAWIVGWPLADLARIYVTQGSGSDAMARNAPNIWSIAQNLGLEAPVLTGMAIAAAVGASIALAARMVGQAGRLRPDSMLRYALFASLLTAGLLPRMHERYFFLADLVALALALRTREREDALIAGMVQAGSLLGIFAYTSGQAQLAAVGGVSMICATWLTGRSLLRDAPANDDPLPLRALPA